MFHDIDENEETEVKQSAVFNQPAADESDDEEKVDSDLEDIFMDAIGEMQENISKSAVSEHQLT